MNIKRTRFRQTWLNAARSASSSTLVSSTMQLDKIIRGRDHKFESALFPTGSSSDWPEDITTKASTNAVNRLGFIFRYSTPAPHQPSQSAHSRDYTLVASREGKGRRLRRWFRQLRAESPLRRRSFSAEAVESRLTVLTICKYASPSLAGTSRPRRTAPNRRRSGLRLERLMASPTSRESGRTTRIHPLKCSTKRTSLDCTREIPMERAVAPALASSTIRSKGS